VCVAILVDLVAPGAEQGRRQGLGDGGHETGCEIGCSSGCDAQLPGRRLVCEILPGC
jgi:hypothetical protein